MNAPGNVVRYLWLVREIAEPQRGCVVSTSTAERAREMACSTKGDTEGACFHDPESATVTLIGTPFNDLSTSDSVVLVRTVLP